LGIGTCGTGFADQCPMGTRTSTALRIRFAPLRRRLAADGLLLRGVRVGGALLHPPPDPRTPVFWLAPRRFVQASPSGGWFVIKPLPKEAKAGS